MAGPDGSLDAIQFAGSDFVQLGTQGVASDASWTIDLWISLPMTGPETWATLTRGHAGDHQIQVGGFEDGVEGRGTELGGYENTGVHGVDGWEGWMGWGIGI